MKYIGTLLSVVLMLTLAPFSAVTALVLYDPTRWGGAPTPLTLIVMSLFAVITVPLWITYIPAIVATPILMNAISRRDAFRKAPSFLLMLLAMPFGAIAGTAILAPCWLMTLSEPADLTINWMFSGAISGTITFTVIVLLYKLMITRTNKGVAQQKPAHVFPKAANGL